MLRTLRAHLRGLAMLIALAATAATPRPARGDARLPVTRVTLGNGLRVVLAPDSLASVLDAALWFPAGTRHETASQTGLALLAARLTFRNGTSDPLAPLAAEGGSGALAVTPDLTSFSATVPAEASSAALAFLADRLPGKPVSAAQLAGERAALRAERTRSERTPVGRALAKLWSAAWPGHAYGQTGAPPAAPGDALAPADVDAWRAARYAPGSAVLSLAGAFDPQRALADVRARFERLPRGAAPAATARGSRPAPPRAAGRATGALDVPARLCLVGWRGPGAADPDAPALELLATCLGEGSQSRLVSSLVRDWNLALTAQAGFVAQQDGSLLWTLAVVQPGADSAAVERTLLDAARGISERAPEAFELERARRQLESTVWFGLQTARQRGEAVGEAEMLAGDAGALDRRLQALDRVTPDDIRRVASRVLVDATRATVWMLPAAGPGAAGGAGAR